MDALSARSLLIVAALQTSISLTALFSSRTASLVAAAIGLLAVGRYAALAFFASTMGSPARAPLRLFAGSAWVLGLLALIAAIAAVALRVRPALPWAVAAAVAGPLGMSALALFTGVGALASARRSPGGPAPGTAGHAGAKR